MTNIEVGVKPLRWEQPDGPDGTSWLAHGTDWCQFYIRLVNDEWMLEGPADNSEDATPFRTLVEAKAAAQSDYEARIRSALIPAPVGEVREALEVDALAQEIRRVDGDSRNRLGAGALAEALMPFFAIPIEAEPVATDGEPPMHLRGAFETENGRFASRERAQVVLPHTTFTGVIGEVLPDGEADFVSDNNEGMTVKWKFFRKLPPPASAPQALPDGWVALNAGRVLIDAWCERYANGMPPVTARDKLVTDIIALSASPPAPPSTATEEVRAAVLEALRTANERLAQIDCAGFTQNIQSQSELVAHMRALASAGHVVTSAAIRNLSGKQGDGQ